MRNGIFKQTISALMLIAIFFATSISVKAYPGELDQSYGITGFYIDNQPLPGNQESTAFFDGETTADGKLTSVGAYHYPVPGLGHAQDFYVQRILPSGVRDSSFNGGFNGNGNVPGSVRFSNFFPPASQSVARAMRIQQDNKIVIAGICNIITGYQTQNQNQSGFGMCAARLNPSGSLDTSFGGNTFQVQHDPNTPSSWFNYTMPAGTTFIHYPGQAETGYSGIFTVVRAAAFDVAIHSDGRIVLAGMTATRTFNAQGGFVGFNHFATLVTLTPNGTLSSAEKIGGEHDMARGFARTFNGVETQSDGSVIAVGENPLVNTEGFITASRWLVYNGNINGAVTWHSENLGVGARATAVKFTRGNKILVSGTDSPYPQLAGSMRRFLSNNLVLDNSFGNNGKVVYCHRPEDKCGTYLLHRNSGTLKVDSIQPDGKILVVVGGEMNGLRFPFNPLDGYAVARLNPDGSVDRSFGYPYGQNPNDLINYGYARLHRETNQGIVQWIEYAGFAKLQADGKILSGGLYQPSQSTFAGTTRRQNTFRNGIYSDFTNDGRADLAVFRPSGGVWHDLNSFNGSHTQIPWGISSDKLTPADFDGDGKTDRAVFRDGVWYIFKSSDNQIRIVQWGIAGDLPRPGDFNGDGEADLAVFRPSDGNWYVFYSNPIQPGNVTHSTFHFGMQGDVPMISDYDGDGKTDYAVFRPSNGGWYIFRTSDTQTQIYGFGINGDIPLNGDFNGDSRADLAVFRPSNQTWYIAQANGVPVQTYDAIQFGFSTDIPVAADYDNDGKTDIAVYRNGEWWTLRSSDGQTIVNNFGLSSDKPIQAAYLP